ncbi:hypothetical protein HXZ77_13540 [Acinetobacter johnsonii]|nr:hypothetical protein [Acinetobacter johnsonii]
MHITPISAGNLTRWTSFIELLVNSGEVDMRITLAPLATSFKEESKQNMEAAQVKVDNKQRSRITFQEVFTVTMYICTFIVLLTSIMDISAWITFLVTISCLTKDHITCYNKLAFDPNYSGFCGHIETLPNSGKHLNEASRVVHITPISAGNLTRWTSFIEKLVNSGEVDMRITQTFSLYG